MSVTPRHFEADSPSRLKVPSLRRCVRRTWMVKASLSASTGGPGPAQVRVREVPAPPASGPSRRGPSGCIPAPPTPGSPRSTLPTTSPGRPRASRPAGPRRGPRSIPACRFGAGCTAASSRARRPSRRSPDRVSPATIAEPRCPSTARAVAPRFCSAWTSPCTRLSASSARYPTAGDQQSPRAVIEDAERERGDELPPCRHHLDASMVEVEMPTGR